MNHRYNSPTALRRALEDRLATRSKQTGIAVNRLRKECAFHRLLARFVTVGGPWALKGGVSLLWRVDPRIRATADVDANWCADEADLDEFLDQVTDCNLDDGFAFDIGDARPLRGETHGGSRFPVLAAMAGREFERFHLDINLIADDPRPVEHLQINAAPMAFADVRGAHLTVPVISLAQQLAEKLHACLRFYGQDQSSTRAKDAFDTVAAARLVPMPGSDDLLCICRDTFDLRGARLPTDLAELPDTWHLPLTRLLGDCPIPVADDAHDLQARFTAFWQPLLHSPGITRRRFDAQSWSWQPEP